MRIQSFLSCAAIGFAASLGVATALAGDVQYIGPSSATFDGDDGYNAGFDNCTATDFAFSVKDVTWCTSQMIIEGGRAPSAPAPDGEGEWVNPVIVAFDGVGDLYVDFSGLTTSSPDRLNCSRWLSITATRGLTYEGGAVSTFGTGDCSDPRPAACCGRKGK